MRADTGKTCFASALARAVALRDARGGERTGETHTPTRHGGGSRGRSPARGRAAAAASSLPGTPVGGGAAAELELAGHASNADAGPRARTRASTAQRRLEVQGPAQGEL